MMEKLILFSIAMVAVLLVRRFLICITLIRGRSMLPTLRNNDIVLVSRLSFLLRPPKRGEIVICFYPGRKMKRFPFLRQPMVKRVIALPGETIEIIEGETVLNGVALPEPYLSSEYTRWKRSMAPVTLGAGQYFVMGDHRDASHDSRRVGPLEQSMLIGRVFMLVWPPRRWRRFRA